MQQQSNNIQIKCRIYIVSLQYATFVSDDLYRLFERLKSKHLPTDLKISNGQTGFYFKTKKRNIQYTRCWRSDQTTCLLDDCISCEVEAVIDLVYYKFKPKGKNEYLEGYSIILKEVRL